MRASQTGVLTAGGKNLIGVGARCPSKAQITERLPDNQGIGVLVPKPRGGHSPWLDVGVAVTFGDNQDHPAAEGTIVLVLPVVVPWAFRNTKTLQGIDKKAGEAGGILANTLGPSFLSHLKIKIG